MKPSWNARATSSPSLPPSRRPVWTAAEIDRAAELWAAGRGLPQIAATLRRETGRDRSVGAVGAMVSRNRDRFLPRQTNPNMRRRATPLATMPKPKREPAPKPAAPPEGETLAMLGAGRCRFPTGGEGAGTVFCAAAVADWRPGAVGGCYCATHRVRARGDWQGLRGSLRSRFGVWA